jgi:S1-C subfamily serine protease
MIHLNCPRCRVLIQLVEAPADGAVTCPECQKKLHLKARKPGPPPSDRAVTDAPDVVTKPRPRAPLPDDLAVTDSPRIANRPPPRPTHSSQGVMVLMVGGIGTAMVLGLVAIVVILLAREESKPFVPIATGPPPGGGGAMSVPTAPADGPVAMGAGGRPGVAGGNGGPSSGPNASRDGKHPPAKDAGAAEADPKPMPPPKKATPEEIHQYVLKSVVWLVNDRGDSVATGTGTLIDMKHRLVVASQQVVHGHKALFAVFPKYEGGKLVTDPARFQQAMEDKAALVQARVVVTVRAKDLALLELDRLPEGVELVPLAVTGAAPGDQVYAVANPAGRTMWTQATGTVKHIGPQQWRSRSRTGQIQDLSAEVIETELPNPLDDGSPLLNTRGELLGIATGNTMPDSPSGRFVSASEIRTFVDDYFRQRGGRWLPDARAPLK